MESKEVRLTVFDEMMESARRDMERFEKKQKEVRDSITATFAPVLAQQREMQERIAAALAPTLRAMNEIQRAMQPYIEEAAKIQKTMDNLVESLQPPVMSFPPDYFREMTPVRYVESSGPTLVRLDDESMDMIVTKVVALLKTEQPETSVIRTRRATQAPAVNMLEGALWDDIELRFADSHTLRVLHKDKLIDAYDYALLGFARKNTRDGLPDKQWEFLTQLSVTIAMKLMKPTTENLSRHLGITQGACEKLKQNLSKKLQAALGISADPFHKYDAAHGYNPKFTLTPEPLLRGDGELHSSAGVLLDWKESDEVDE